MGTDSRVERTETKHSSEEANKSDSTCASEPGTRELKAPHRSPDEAENRGRVESL